MFFPQINRCIARVSICYSEKGIYTKQTQLRFFLFARNNVNEFNMYPQLFPSW